MTKLDREIQEGLYDPETKKKCEPGICKALEKKGIECDTVDIPALIDSELSCEENKKEILKEFGARKTDKYSEYERQQKSFYGGQGKLAHASPEQRAAAFARMKEDGTLRGYDPKLSRQQRFEKESRTKAHEGKKLKGQQTLTSAVSTSHRLSEFGFDPKRRKSMKYIDFVKQHKAWRVPGSNALDFERIGKAWQEAKRKHEPGTLTRIKGTRINRIAALRKVKEQRLRKAKTKKQSVRRYDPKKPLNTELKVSIRDEQKAIDDYGKIITHAKKVRPAIVKGLEEIRNDEKEHKAKFIRMMKK